MIPLQRVNELKKPLAAVHESGVGPKRGLLVSGQCLLFAAVKIRYWIGAHVRRGECRRKRGGALNESIAHSVPALRLS
jgi:hypothetical protein